jgi:hypothetical protein
MVSVSSRTCIALTWRSTGACCGVRLRRSGERHVVVSAWRGQADTDGGLSGRLAEGFGELGGDPETLLVLGGGGLSCGLVDLVVPRLMPADMRKALRFELAKFAPLPEDRLVWGYRLLPGTDRTRQSVRLIYMRESVWRRWLEEASALGHGVDCILPPVAALDPLLADRPMWIPADGNGDGYVLSPAASALRVVRPAAAGQDAAFGGGATPLAAPGLEPGPLAPLPAIEQRAFGEAVLLAMYGLSRARERDRRTWLAVPFEMKPHRNRTARFIVLALIVYILGLAGISVGRAYYAAATHLGRLNAEIERTEAAIRQIEQGADPSLAIEELRDEFREAHIVLPSLPACLLELTGLIQDDAWVTDFNWNRGLINVDLSAASEDVNLRQRLEDSPLFEQVIILGTQVGRDNALSISLQMRATIDGLPQTDSAAPDEREAEEPGGDEGAGDPAAPAEEGGADAGADTTTEPGDPP